MFSPNHDYLPILSFEEAHRAYTTTTPIRTTGAIPLQFNRRAHSYKYLRKLHDGSYACHLYHSDVVTFHPDGSITVDLTYDTRMTRNFANCFLRGNVYATTEHGATVLSTSGGKFPAGHKPIRLIDGEPDPSTVPQMVRDVLNRKRAAQVRKQLTPLCEYLTTLATLDISDEAVRAMRDNAPYHGRFFYEHFENPEHWPGIASHMLCRQHYASWRMRQDWRPVLYKWAYNAFHAYDVEPVPYGTVEKKAYRQPTV